MTGTECAVGAGAAAAVPVTRRQAAGLLTLLDLDRPELAAARQADRAGDDAAALAAVLAYYRARPVPTVAAAHDEAHHPTDAASAHALLDGRITLQGRSGALARRADGGIDWSDIGPAGDREWAWLLNRHLCFATLAKAYGATTDERFAAAFDAILGDWLAANPYRGGDERGFAWRPMEAATRVLSSWPAAWQSFQPSDAFGDATRAAMLASIAEHADCLRRHHRRRHNHAIKEMAGLICLAVHWPEFREAAAWRDYGLAVLDEELAWQCYPDGVHKELCVGYHATVLRYVADVVRLAAGAGCPVPPRLRAGVDAMLHYVDQVRRPNGCGPHNNDSDDDDLTDLLASLGRPTAAPEPMSRIFPWAGQLVMRGGGQPATQWAFFDAGPAGTAASHVHRGRLHLSLSAHGRDLLVDAGRYTYRSSPERDFFTSSVAHNVLLVDGCGQHAAAPEWTEPRAAMAATDVLDYARGRFVAGFDGLDGRAEHERVVLYVKPRYWLVIDHVASDRPREITALWHFHPDCAVSLDGDDVVALAGGAGLRIRPLGPPAWRYEIVRGRPAPAMQGWWSGAYNRRVPSASVEARTRVDGDAAFGWLLLPVADGDVGPPAGWTATPPDRVTVQVGGDRLSIRIGTPLPKACQSPAEGPAADVIANLSDSGRCIAFCDTELLRAAADRHPLR